MARDYYTVLGISRTADEKEIKAAYRKLARKYHPDLNPNDPQAEARFKEVTNAYEVLSEPEKRKQYDRFGENWEQASNVGPGADFSGFQGGGFESIFDVFMGGFGGHSDFRQRTVPSQDIEKQVEISLREVDLGTKRVLTFRTDDACTQCKGAGTIIIMGGNRANCPTCRGSGMTSSERKVEVNIPAGIQDGKKLRVPERGTRGSSGRAGDLYVAVRVALDPDFRRRGDDLETEVELDFLTAALGGTIRVPTLASSGTISVPEGTQSGQLFRLKGQGLPKLGSREKGDLLARVKITVPTKLDKTERELLEKLQQLLVKKS